VEGGKKGFFLDPVNSVQDKIRKAFKKLQLIAVCAVCVFYQMSL
jgi:hypothetical protein